MMRTSKIHGNENDTTCLLCQNDAETVEHFLFICPHFDTIRSEKIPEIQSNDPDFDTLNINNKLRYILNLNCPDTNIGACCNFVMALYTQREKDNCIRIV